MTGIDDLLRRVSAKAGATTEHLPPPVTAQEVAHAERSLGFRLPPVLTRLYREVANGGFGPDYQFLPLLGEGRTAVNDYHRERDGSGPGGDTHWPAEVLPVLDWGCGMYAAVDCRGSEETVLLFEPNGIDGGWHRAWYVDSESLIDWLETWIAETGWYEEDVEEDGDMRPWDPAQRRLAEGR
ncbi:SMI1/KNR4 family protein [Streptosporangium sp. NPDC023615]|uniref:SMI1/KNR4 family protein n=1 Tax=Streptosporangium sp. NPDC023615 TaxID=3154794 RepID=UPI003429AE18